MLMNVSKKIELIANVAIIVVACLLAAVLVKNYFFAKPSQQANKSESQRVQSKSQLGNDPNVSSLDIDWKQNKQTLLLAVSSTCHFCTESAPFYKQLVKEHLETRLIAVFPQSMEEGKRYFDELGISVDEVKQAPLRSINVNGTPTLILVNSEGVVLNTWVGKLLEAQQKEVLTKLRS